MTRYSILSCQLEAFRIQNFRSTHAETVYSATDYLSSPTLLNGTNRFVFVTETSCVLFGILTEFLNII
jgi:hypothetical protein